MLALSLAAPSGSARGHAGARHAGPLDVVPFEPWHLSWLTDTTEQAWIARTPDYARALKDGGPCFTAFAGMRVVACAGIVPYWEGRVQAWSILSADVGAYAMGIHRAVRRFLDTYPARRIECSIDPRSETAVRWATRLGFEYEGTMRGYTPSGDTMDLYARVTWPK